MPVVVGAVRVTLATPEVFVVAEETVPLSVNDTVRPEIAVPDVVVSVAESAIDAPGAALVGPVYTSAVGMRTRRVAQAVPPLVLPALSVSRTQTW